jgi:F0F1-type ATP synthase alpha subunit
MKELTEYVEGRHGDVLKALHEKKQLDDPTRGALDKALAEFREVFQAEA